MGKRTVDPGWLWHLERSPPERLTCASAVKLTPLHHQDHKKHEVNQKSHKGAILMSCVDPNPEHSSPDNSITWDSVIDIDAQALSRKTFYYSKPRDRTQQTILKPFG